MYELDKEAFGRFLAGLRKEKGLTQRQLAERLFVSDKAVSKWERGVSLRYRDRPPTLLLPPSLLLNHERSPVAAKIATPAPSAHD